MAYEPGLNYNGGTTASPSTVDKSAGNDQLRQNHYNKKAVIDIKDEMILSQMSGTMAMPKNKGKEVVKHRYIALLDDANANGGEVGLDTTGTAYVKGNLYGSSRGTGFIAGKLPDLGEDSLRVNKVSFSRKEVKGNIVNRGFFFEWSKDEVNFDSDPQMKQHITTEAVRGANQVNEDILAIELINGAGVNFYAGSDGTPTLAEVNGNSVPTIRDLIRLDTELDNNKCPRDTKVITGSRMIDTKTVAAARFMFISPDVKMDFMAIKKLNGTEDAFVPVEQYEGATSSRKHIKTIHGEIGKVGPFRLVVHPKMVRHSDTTDNAVGATWAAADNNEGGTANGAEYRNDGSKYEVYPCLVVGSDAFTHLGFETGAGTGGKFNVVSKTPEQLRSKENPYAKTGMTVIEFWNGVLIERPEWIAVYNICSKY